MYYRKNENPQEDLFLSMYEQKLKTQREKKNEKQKTKFIKFQTNGNESFFKRRN